MRFLCGLLLCVPLISPSVLAQRAGWRLATESKPDKEYRRTRVYYDRSRITRPAKGRARLWIKFVESKYSQDTKESTLILLDLRCAEGQFRALSRAQYDREGNAIPQYGTKPGAWEYITPDTLLEGVLDIICSGKKDLAQIYHERAEENYEYGLAEEKSGNYEKAHEWFEYSLLWEDAPKYRAARDRMKAKLPQEINPAP